MEEITTFDLLKSALRQRPDYIIVGEVRGEEAYTLFKSIAVGHGGLCTIHADSLKSVIKRLMSRPMNIPEIMLPLMNVLLQIRRVKINNNIARRVVTVAEITGLPTRAHIRASQNEEAVQIEKKYEWDAENDSFIYNEIYEIDALLGESKSVFNQISEINHISIDKLEEELLNREIILKWMADTEIYTYEKVAEVIRNYYQDPDEVLNAAKLGSRI